MLKEERQLRVLEMLWVEGKLVATDLSEALGVSEDTVRRDLRELAEAGKLQRVHGGALPRSAVTVVRWRAWLYGVMVLAGLRAWGLGRGPIRPPGRWWGGSGRWSLGTLWRGYRSEMWGVEEFREVLTPTGGGWVRKEGLMAGLSNAVGGSQRL